MISRFRIESLSKNTKASRNDGEASAHSLSRRVGLLWLGSYPDFRPLRPRKLPHAENISAAPHYWAFPAAFAQPVDSRRWPITVAGPWPICTAFLASDAFTDSERSLPLASLIVHAECMMPCEGCQRGVEPMCYASARSAIRSRFADAGVELSSASLAARKLL